MPLGAAGTCPLTDPAPQTLGGVSAWTTAEGEKVLGKPPSQCSSGRGEGQMLSKGMKPRLAPLPLSPCGSLQPLKKKRETLPSLKHW